MPNRNEHERLVREVASEMGATVEISGNGHYRICGKGWYITLSSTPKRGHSKSMIQQKIKNAVMRMAVKRAEGFKR